MMKTFHDLLDEIDAGGVTTELNRLLRDLLMRNGEIAEETGATTKGTLSIALEVSTEGRSKRTTVTAKLASKGACKPHTPAVFFVTEAGELSDRDPRQMELEGVRRAKGRVAS